MSLPHHRHQITSVVVYLRTTLITVSIVILSSWTKQRLMFCMVVSIWMILSRTILQSIEHAIFALNVSLLWWQVAVYLIENFGAISCWWEVSCPRKQSIEIIFLVSWPLTRRSSHVNLHSLRAIKNVSHVSEFNLSATPWRSGSFLILLKSHMIIFNSFGKVSSLILTCTSSISSIDVIRIDFQYCCEVFDTLINLAKLFKSTASDIISSSIHRI